MLAEIGQPFPAQIPHFDKKVFNAPPQCLASALRLAI